MLVLNDETLGGSSRASLRALEPLVQRGLELRVWCARPSELFDELVATGYAVDGAPRMLRYSLRTLRHPPGAVRRLASVPPSLMAFGRYLRAQRPDVVHANSTLSLPEAAVARTMGTPVFFHSHEAAWPGIKGMALRRVAWRVAHEVGAVSEANARPLTRGERRPRLIQGPAPAILPRSALKRTGEPVRVAMVGAIEPRKGVDVYLAAAEMLRERATAAELHLIGAVPDSPVAAWATVQLDRARAAGVVYREHVDVAGELPAWDIVVLPSRQDPFPLVALESMAAARAVIGTRVDGIAEQLSEGAGVLIPPDDPGALADAVEALAADPDARAQLGARAHRRATERYGTERAARGLTEAYEAAIRAAERRRPRLRRGWLRPRR